MVICIRLCTLCNEKQLMQTITPGSCIIDITMESIYDTYEEPFDELGYTHLATISTNQRNYDDLRPTSSNENYASVIDDNKCRIKLLIALTTVTIIACALSAGLTYVVIKSQYSTKVYNPSKVSEKNGNEKNKIPDIRNADKMSNRLDEIWYVVL